MQYIKRLVINQEKLLKYIMIALIQGHQTCGPWAICSRQSKILRPSREKKILYLCGPQEQWFSEGSLSQFLPLSLARDRFRHTSPIHSITAIKYQLAFHNNKDIRGNFLTMFIGSLMQPQGQRKRGLGALPPPLERLCGNSCLFLVNCAVFVKQ